MKNNQQKSMSERGGKREGAGRPKGVPNKTTTEIRESFQRFVEDNVDHFQEWLERVAEKNPAKAIELVNNMSEYILPKLSRAEIKAEVETKGEIDLSKLPKEVLDKLLDESNEDTTTS